MSVKIKSKKHLKREQVIPFSGEENFVVPRKGGFGMSDNEDYISVARADISDKSYSNLSIATLGVDDSSNDTGAGGGSAGGSAVVDYAPRGNELPLPIPDVSVSDKPKDTPTPIDYAPRGEETPPPPPPPPPPIEPAPPIDTPTPDEPTTPLPTYPDWNSLSCEELSSSIQVFDRKLSSGKYTPEAATLGNNELAKAKTIYINKGCDVKAPPPPPIDTPTPTGGGTTVTNNTTFTPTFGGGGFGSAPSGGGGGGDEAKKEPKKKDYSWLWLLLIVGGIYIATRKKKGVK